ncbi:hypothetical protein HMPREF3048_05315 [Corynebacterium sp. HMSC075D04]|uniref:hypothetical protein n=1 Tax=Corynebacterium sp. HMSC075D04 TaxID=1739540 RepID=UPI0008A25E16|nr:hypothetical protein [Corynebacterium sp. HMSC075D04]OFO36177.1 hypothetical protein HMPREF3048_05315 [Corynebacterium sp. HMSC075D04]
MKLFKNPFTFKRDKSNSPLADLSHELFRVRILVGPENVPEVQQESVGISDEFDKFYRQLGLLGRISTELSHLDHRLISYGELSNIYQLDLKPQLLGSSTYILFADALEKFAENIEFTGLRPNITQAKLMLSKLQFAQVSQNFWAIEENILYIEESEKSQELSKLLCNDLRQVPPTTTQLVVLHLREFGKAALAVDKLMDLIGVPTAILELTEQSGEELLERVGIRIKDAS